MKPYYFLIIINLIFLSSVYAFNQLTRVQAHNKREEIASFTEPEAMRQKLRRPIIALNKKGKQRCCKEKKERHFSCCYSHKNGWRPGYHYPFDFARNFYY